MLRQGSGIIDTIDTAASGAGVDVDGMAELEAAAKLAAKVQAWCRGFSARQLSVRAERARKHKTRWPENAASEASSNVETSQAVQFEPATGGSAIAASIAGAEVVIGVMPRSG